MGKFCSNCGTELAKDANACSNCGTLVDQAPKTVDSTVKNQTNGFAIAGFVLSLVSLVCCGITSTLGLIFSIIGLVQSKKMDGKGKGLAIAGIVICCVFVVLVILLYALGFATAIAEGIVEGVSEV